MKTQITSILAEKKIKNFNLNFGPAHPAAHGVSRLTLELDGELIVEATPHIGLLHRGTEKSIETKMFLQALPYFDRLDYVSMMAQEHAFCLSIEKLRNINVTERAKAIRVLFSEITRILNHIMAVTTHATDVGALTPFLWASEEREKLMESYERVSGARMHAAFSRPGGVAYDLPIGLEYDIYKFRKQFVSRINEIEELLSNNRIWNIRLKNVGTISRFVAQNNSLSGVLARGSGITVDIRKNFPYEAYNYHNFTIPIGYIGDCFDRHLLRIEEMRQSVIIITNVLNTITEGLVYTDDFKIKNVTRNFLKNDMQSIIHHFKYYSTNFTIINNENYIRIEAPKGEFGVTLITDNTNKAYRCKIKSPGFAHLQAANIMAQKHLLADIVTIIGTQDIAFGEVDR